MNFTEFCSLTSRLQQVSTDLSNGLAPGRKTGFKHNIFFQENACKYVSHRMSDRHFLQALMCLHSVNTNQFNSTTAKSLKMSSWRHSIGYINYTMSDFNIKITGHENDTNQNFPAYVCGVCCNIRKVSKPHLLLKSCYIWFNHYINYHCSIILQFCTEHGSYTAVLCAKFVNNWTIH